MLNSPKFEKYSKLLLNILVKRIFREEIRMGGLKAVRAYIQGVGYVRMGAIGLISAIAFVSFVMTGFVLLVGGLLAVIGVTPEVLAWTALITGAILVTLGIIALIVIFNQKRWLDLTRSYELMDAVIEPAPQLT